MARSSRYADCHLFHTLLYIVGPVVLFALLFFNLTFIALGSSYVPTEELLYKEEQSNCSAIIVKKEMGGG